MYENFKHKHPINTEGAILNKPVSFPYLNVTPLLPGVRPLMSELDDQVKEVDFTDWRDETLAWHLTCTLHAGLNPTPVTVIKGPDAAKFLKKAFVNNIDKFPIGSSKHGIMCSDNGYVAGQGCLMRTAEDTYEAFWLSPYLEYAFSREKYDCVLEDISAKRFVFQTQGPHCLEMLEDATDDDLHDIKFCRFRNSHIAGHEVRIFRFGMASVIGYEIHGNIEDAHEIYMAIINAGNPYGLRRMGKRAYEMNHTPGGNVQMITHFFSAAELDQGFASFISPETNICRDENSDPDINTIFAMTGSLGDDVYKRLVNPIEIGLEKIIDFNKDFYGKEAILEYKKNPKRGIVTLKWNPDDLADIYASQFRDGEPYQQMDTPGPGCTTDFDGCVVSMDLVTDKEGNEIGFSSGRTVCFYDRAMLSLAVINLNQMSLGNEVVIIWGDVGTHQKKVRATVSPYPYNTHLVNRSFDVESIPHPSERNK